MVTYSLLGLPFAIARPIIALITGVFGGGFTNKVAIDEREVVKDQNPEDEVPRTGNKIPQIWNYAFDEFRFLLKLLIAQCFCHVIIFHQTMPALSKSCI